MLVPRPSRAALDLPELPTAAAEALAYRDSLDVATAHLRAGEFAAAEPIYQELSRTFPQDARVWSGLGLCHYRLKRFDESAREYLRAVQLGVPFPTVYIYDAACSEALAGQQKEAMITLKRALAEGLEDRSLVGQDSDLDSLHDLPDWPEVAGLLPAGITDRVAGWRYDLDFWWKEVRRLHPAPFAKTPESEFLARIKSLHDRIPKLSDEQIMMEFVKLAALLGDGHSGIRPMPRSRIQLRSLPLQLYVFTDGVFVIDANEDYTDLIGARVLSLGTREVDGVWPDLAELVPRDNPMRILQQGPFLLTIPAVLRELGAIGDTETVPVKVRDATGKERTVEVESMPMGRVNFELIPSKLPGAGKAPLYLSHADDVLWMGALDGGHVLYVEFNVVRDGPNESITEFAGRMKTRLTENPEIDTVIVDVRNNGGGNSFLYPPLVKTLVYYEGLRDDTELYVLLGRQTFSACENFVTDLDTWTGAVFVGEPSGSRPNMIGESTFSLLPYSGLRAGISSRYHQESYPGDARLWIAPSIPIGLGSEDYFANRDPILDTVLSAVAKGQ
jgi:hypothetical protein